MGETERDRWGRRETGEDREEGGRGGTISET